MERGEEEVISGPVTPTRTRRLLAAGKRIALRRGRSLSVGALVLLAGCATSEPVKLTTPEQVECGKKATASVKAQYPNAVLDAAGVPVSSAPMGDGFSAYSMYGVVFDRCMERRGGY